MIKLTRLAVGRVISSTDKMVYNPPRVMTQEKLDSGDFATTPIKPYVGKINTALWVPTGWVVFRSVEKYQPQRIPLTPAFCQPLPLP